jgi:predicted lipoprotein with Yx(FWY)xxD motif
LRPTSPRRSTGCATRFRAVADRAREGSPPIGVNTDKVTTIGREQMSGNNSGAATRLRRMAIVIVTMIAGVGTAVLVSAAVARTFTLNIAKDASVTNFNTHVTTKENIATNSAGLAVYTLTGDSKTHPECTMANGCLSVWPAVKVASAGKLSKASGIKGKLGVWRRDGFDQVTLGGHPLYTFKADTRHHATGEDITHFGGTWHVIKTSAGPSTTMTTGTTTTSPYQPGY